MLAKQIEKNTDNASFYAFKHSAVNKDIRRILRFTGYMEIQLRLQENEGKARLG